MSKSFFVFALFLISFSVFLAAFPNAGQWLEFLFSVGWCILILLAWED